MTSRPNNTIPPAYKKRLRDKKHREAGIKRLLQNVY